MRWEWLSRRLGLGGRSLVDRGEEGVDLTDATVSRVWTASRVSEQHGGISANVRIVAGIDAAGVLSRLRGIAVNDACAPYDSVDQ